MNYLRCFVVMALPWFTACASPGGPATGPLPGTPAAPSMASPTAPSPLALSCLGCHQPSVDSPSMPALDGWPPERIVDWLRNSRDSQPPGSVMARFTAKLSDAQIDALASQLGGISTP